MKIKVLLSIALSLALICSGTSVWAKVAGPCADCHTMHNSQNGEVDTTKEGASLTDGPSRSLTKGDCVGCHTGTNTSGGNIPYITDTTEPTYTSADGSTGNTLAGGSFYWIDTDDATAHNVANIKVGQDSNINSFTPPGWDPAVTSNTIANGDADWANQLTCAGTYGCHGSHGADDDFQDIAGAHHGDDTVIDGSTAAKSYRFLNGIIGYEDPDWEFQPTASARNEYHAEGRAQISAAGSESDKKTISYFCATCHGNYHSGAEVSYAGQDVAIGDNPWLRHPSDYDMADTAADSEYRDYNGDGTYSVEAPVAFNLGTSVDQSTHTLSSVAFTGDAAIVTCISCHRAHGSEYADLLRWDYNSGTSTMEAASGNNNTGCFVCHTTKDDA